MQSLRTVVLLPLACLTFEACDGGGKPVGPPVTDRGPTAIHVDGDPNGLWWDDAEQVLYVADDNGNRILRWTDEDGLALAVDLPAPSPDGAGLGQVIRTPDGTVAVTRFGYGTSGDVAFVPSGGDPQIVPGLDVERRRIGLTVSDGGTMFDGWFVRLATGDRVGAVGVLSLTGQETEVVTGLKKPVGVLAVGQTLFISDQDLGQVLASPLGDPSAYSVLATVEQPDLLAPGPDGAIFAGGANGSVYRIPAAGEAEVFAGGFQQVRGVAFDSTNRRLFLADHDADESDGVTHLLHILPVD